MDFDHIYKNTGGQRNNFDNFSYRNNLDAHQQYGFVKNFGKRALIGHILNTPKLKAAIVIGLVITTIILVGLVALLFPLIINLVDYIVENGISGITDKMVIFIETLWNGNK